MNPAAEPIKITITVPRIIRHIPENDNFCEKLKNRKMMKTNNKFYYSKIEFKYIYSQLFQRFQSVKSSFLQSCQVIIIQFPVIFLFL